MKNLKEKGEMTKANGLSRRRFLQSASIGLASIGLVPSLPRTAAAASTSSSQDGLNFLGKPDLSKKSASHGKKVIGYVAGCAQCALTSRTIQAHKLEAARRGWEIRVTDTAGDYSKAPGLFETFIQSGVDILVESAIDPGMLGNVVAKAKAEKIPVFVESNPWGPGFECSIGQNAFEMGQKQALWIATRLKGKGNVAVLTSSPIPVVAQREAVLRTILGQFPGINIIETHELDLTNPVDDARKAMEVWLIKHSKPGEIGAVWGAWDDPAVGAATAIDVSGRKDIFVIGNDAGPDIIEMMRSGSSFDGDIWIDTMSMSTELFHQIDRVLLGKGVEARDIYVNQPLISPHLGNLPKKGENPEPAGTYFVWPYKG